MKILLNISIIIYIFLLFNREFVPFVDLRMIALPIFIMLIFIQLIQLIQKKSITFFGTKKIFILFLLFLSIIALSNIKWYFNPYSPNEKVLLNTIVLYIYNFSAILVFSLYWNKLNIKFLAKIAVFSGFILFCSIFLQFVGVDSLPFAGHIKGMVDDGFSPLGHRFGGYAQDQNYATFGMVIWMFISSIFLKNKFLLFVVYALALFGILLSFSKTIILGLIFIWSFFLAKKMKLLIPYTIFMTLTLLITSYYIISFMDELSTMSIRFEMWQIALKDFINNPIMGSGISSVRSNFLYHGGWYVQSHSSFIAMLHDFGIFAFILYVTFFYKASIFIKNKHYLFLLGLLIFLSFTQELFVFQYPYFILGILPILVLVKENHIHTTKIRI